MEVIFKLSENAFIPSADNEENLPNGSGIYLICVKDIINLPLNMRNLEYKFIKEDPVLYVGISKRQGLRRRDYNNHFRGSARNSTLRKSLGVLFGYEKYFYENGKYRFTIEHENQLSDWMKNNLILYYYPTETRQDESIIQLCDIETTLIEYFNPPLNINNNFNTINKEFRDELKSLRRGRR